MFVSARSSEWEVDSFPRVVRSIVIEAFSWNPFPAALARKEQVMVVIGECRYLCVDFFFPLGPRHGGAAQIR